jgi:lipid-A-disaccharide synthase
MVILYKTNRVLWHLIGRWLVHSKFFTLVNLLADRELVPEFIPYFTSIEPVLDTIDTHLHDAAGLARVSNELIDLVEPMTRKKASDETAAIVTEMLGRV